MYEEIKKKKEEPRKLTKKQRLTMIKRISILVVTLVILGFALYFGIKIYNDYLRSVNKITMELNGENEISIEYGMEYKEEGATSIYKDIDVSSDIKIENTLDVNKIGQYKIKYTYTSPDGKWTESIERVILVQDKKIPTIELKGSKDMFNKLNVTFKEPGYTAYDEYDGDITSKVVIDGSVDTAKAGEYTLVYTVRDTSENTYSETRTVKVAEQDTKPTGGDAVEIKRVPQTYEINPLSTVYVGDSTTLHLGYHSVVAYGQVWNKPSMDPNTVNIWTANIGQNDSGLTIKQLAEKYKPKQMVITLGSNGASWMKEDYFASRYTELINSIKQVSPNTNIFVQSIFPVTADYDAQGKGLNNENINKMNNALKDMAKEIGIKYLDTNSKLVDTNGKLKVGYSNGDGVHLNATGCQIVVDFVKANT